MELRYCLSRLTQQYQPRARRVGNLVAGFGADGRQMTYARDGELYIASRDSTAIRKLATFGSSLYSPCWSPDGRRIRFSGRTRDARPAQLWDALARVATPAHFDGEQGRVFKTDATRLSWSSTAPANYGSSLECFFSAPPNHEDWVSICWAEAPFASGMLVANVALPPQTPNWRTCSGDHFATTLSEH
jgi:hypothetical protein